MANVYTNHTLAGTLGRQDIFTRFTYARNLKPEQTISLTMPVTREAMVFDMRFPKAVHPVFAMNLPEGNLRAEIANMFAKVLPNTDDLAILEIVGRSQIGRIRHASSVEELCNIPGISLNSLLGTKNSSSLFHDLLQRYARYSGVAGVQPKLLARNEDTPDPDKKITATGTTHIVKFFDENAYPALAANEFACLTAAKAAGIPVPAFRLADDRQCLAIERFDLKPDGTYLAVEDACALASLQPDSKYTGSYEQLARLLAAAINPKHHKEDMATFFKSFVLTIIVRNGDAHRKNFSVLYNTPGDVRLSPAYDIISTTPYLPNDTIALMLNGSKRWPGRKNLLQFATNFCNIEPQGAGAIIDQTREAVAHTRELLITMRKEAGSTHEGRTLASMINSWEDGLRQTASAPLLS